MAKDPIHTSLSILRPLGLGALLALSGCGDDSAGGDSETSGTGDQTTTTSTGTSSSDDTDTDTDPGATTSPTEPTTATETTASSVCGDGLIDGDEECDDGDLNGTEESLCLADCTLKEPLCGDGIVDVDEECDDGPLNGAPDSDCADDCTEKPIPVDCGPPPVKIDFELVGADIPPGACENHTFTGRLVSVEGNVWTLDSCPCGDTCPDPDPYILTIDLSKDSLLPSMISCPHIVLRRNVDTCEPVSMVISVDEPGTPPRWIASKAPFIPPGLFIYGVNSVDLPACDGQPRHGLEFTVQNKTLRLAQGASGSLMEGTKNWSIHNFASTVTMDGGEWAYVMRK